MLLSGTYETVERHRVRDTLSQRMDELCAEDIEELAKRASIKNPLFEKQHPRGADGKFGKKAGGAGSKGKGSGFPIIDPGNRPIKITQKKGETSYEMTLADGSKVQLVDKTGKAGPFAKDWLDAVANMQELYGLKPPRKLIVDKEIPRDLIGTYSWVVKNNAALHFLDIAKGKKSLLDRSTTDNEIHINYWVMSGKNLSKNVQNAAHPNSDPKDKSDKPGNYMNQAQTANTVHYILSHEFGHTYEFTKGRSSAANALFKDNRVSSYMSKYGSGNAHEAYAETFAEWHISKGATTNPVAKAYAKHEKWVGYQDIQASGAVEFVGAMFNGIGITDNVVLNPSNQTIIGDFFDGRPAILLGPPDPEPTTEEINKAKSILDEFLPI